MDKFEPNKRYKFSKDIWLSSSSRAALYKNSSAFRQMIDKFDGIEVAAEGAIGFIDSFVIFPQFCEEIIPHMTQIVREVADKRYKTALQKALEQHPKMDAGKIVRYGCPYRYGVGVKPVWCDDSLKTVDQCRGCWNQKGEER